MPAPLSAYIQVAMRRARYEIIEDGTFFGEIPECEGLWANGPSLEQCRDELQAALEDWIILGLRLGDRLPVIDGIDLNLRLEAAAR